MSSNFVDLQQLNRLLPNMNQSGVRNVYDAFTQDRGLSNFNAGAFMQGATAMGGFGGRWVFSILFVLSNSLI